MSCTMVSIDVSIVLSPFEGDRQLTGEWPRKRSLPPRVSVRREHECLPSGFVTKIDRIVRHPSTKQRNNVIVQGVWAQTGKKL